MEHRLMASKVLAVAHADDDDDVIAPRVSWASLASIT